MAETGASREFLAQLVGQNCEYLCQLLTGLELVLSSRSGQAERASLLEHGVLQSASLVSTVAMALHGHFNGGGHRQISIDIVEIVVLRGRKRHQLGSGRRAAHFLVVLEIEIESSVLYLLGSLVVELVGGSAELSLRVVNGLHCIKYWSGSFVGKKQAKICLVIINYK